MQDSEIINKLQYHLLEGTRQLERLLMFMPMSMQYAEIGNRVFLETIKEMIQSNIELAKMLEANKTLDSILQEKKAFMLNKYDKLKNYDHRDVFDYLNNKYSNLLTQVLESISKSKAEK